MEKEERRPIEILIGIIFVVFLFLVIFFVMNLDAKETTITNSYNTYNIYSTAQPRYVSTKPYIIDREDYTRIYYLQEDSRDVESDEGYLRYYEEARLKAAEGILGNDIDRYEVYVKNREYVGGYFTVIFYFEDYYGKTRSESITHYIPAKEEKLFLFKDISPYEYIIILEPNTIQ